MEFPARCFILLNHSSPCLSCVVSGEGNGINKHGSYLVRTSCVSGPVLGALCTLFCLIQICTNFVNELLIHNKLERYHPLLHMKTLKVKQRISGACNKSYSGH